MTPIEQLKAQVGRIERKLDKMLKTDKAETHDPFLWENEVATECRCEVSTLRAYKSRGKFTEGKDFIKTGKKTQYKKSSVLRVLRDKNKN